MYVYMLRVRYALVRKLNSYGDATSVGDVNNINFRHHSAMNFLPDSYSNTLLKWNAVFACDEIKTKYHRIMIRPLDESKYFAPSPVAVLGFEHIRTIIVHGRAPRSALLMCS